MLDSRSKFEVIRGMLVRVGAADLRAQGDVSGEAVAAGARGVAFARVAADGATLEGPAALVSGLDEIQTEQLIGRLECQPEDLLLFAAGSPELVAKTLDRVRLFLGRSLGVSPHLPRQLRRLCSPHTSDPQTLHTNRNV